MVDQTTQNSEQSQTAGQPGTSPGQGTAPETGEPRTPAGVHDEPSSDSSVDYASMFGGLTNDENDASEESQPSSEEGAEDEAGQQPAEQSEAQESEEGETPAESQEESGEQPTQPESPEQTQESGEEQQQTEEGQQQPAEGEGKTQEELRQEVEAAEQRTREAIDEARQKRGESIDKLAKEHYGKLFDEKTWEQIRENPQEVIPKLLATVYVDAVQGTFSQIHEHMPNFIRTELQRQDLNDNVERQFYEEYPMLNDPKFTDDIAAFGKMYHQQNPNASLEDRIRYVGTAVCMKHKLAPPDLGGQRQAASQPQQQQPQPQRQTPPPPVREGDTSFGQPTPSGNPFEVLADELLADEE